MTAGAVTYEVRLRIDEASVAAFDSWLAGHVDEMLRFDGFESAETIESESPDAGTSLRIVRYRVASRAQLQDYLDSHAARMREQGVERFGDTLSATREIYPAAVTDTAYATKHHCRNCEAPLRGQYCAECGQRDKHRIISLWALMRDVVGDLFELDSRVWRTAIPLLFKPGHLTTEYLRGRQVRYTPPFRLYLVTSLVFFVVAFFGAGTPQLEINGDESGVDEVVAEIQREIDAAKAEADRQRQSESPGGTDTADDPVPAGTAAGQSAGASNADGDDREDQCSNISFGEQPWQQQLTERARIVCQRLTAEGGAKRFFQGLIDNLPGMMFFFLPVIALVMKPLYPLSRRYYVEHLLFFVHYHSFFFLAMTISVLVSRLPAAVPGQGVAGALLTTALIFYAPIYLFVAMRRVYGQHFLVTAMKFVALMAAYFAILLVVFIMVVLFTALSL